MEKNFYIFREIEKKKRSRYFYYAGAAAAAFLSLFLMKCYSYLLFHSVVEMFVAVIAVAIFIFAWNTRKIIDNNFLLILGIGYLFVGIFHMFHFLSYKGMGVFEGYTEDFSTQIWIAARYFESISILLAILLMKKKFPELNIFAAYSAAFLAVSAAIITGVFPACYIEGQGLTPFKIISELIVCLILGVSLFLLHVKKNMFEKKTLQYLTVSIALTIASELVFTVYNDVYGILNMIGHYIMFLSFYAIYKTIISVGLLSPYTYLFRNVSEQKEMMRDCTERADLYFNYTDSAFIELDRRGNVIRLNTAALDAMGYRPGELDGIQLFRISDESMRELDAERLDRFMAGDNEAAEGLFSALLDKSGNVVFWEWKVYGIMGRDNKLEKVLLSSPVRNEG